MSRVISCREAPIPAPGVPITACDIGPAATDCQSGDLQLGTGTVTCGAGSLQFQLSIDDGASPPCTYELWRRSAINVTGEGSFDLDYEEQDAERSAACSPAGRMTCNIHLRMSFQRR